MYSFGEAIFVEVLSSLYVCVCVCVCVCVDVVGEQLTGYHIHLFKYYRVFNMNAQCPQEAL